MIDAKELRIGNKVLKNGVFVCDVLSLRRNEIEISFEKEIYALEYKNVQPIALTEEILLKCGFVDGSQGYRATGHNFAFSKDVNSQCKIDLYQGDHYHEASQTYGWHIGYYPNMIYYLHQLQNLYFALTGEELNVNL